VGGRSADRDYVRFLEATLGLADAAEELPQRARFGLAVAILTVCESDGAARTALGSGERPRLQQAAARLRDARDLLADADLDLRRRRTLALVA
jgi:hypothetical protein